ncbi:DNA polymerase III subunit chi [Holospora elegans E1]|uniref:DNA polymerase III subunit chi n=1 Tax=Holospora elegans E1 TaxID=1427503 RepID=A0A023DZE1_9PROT|nr:DNA polymerase III subunit chi [Holospora elegans]GAJ46390.1 DNA polymerase III subunit chi [Holospora elegans E1]
MYWCNTLQPKEKVLPHVVEKILAQRKRCSILNQSIPEIELWDDRLWTFSSKSFLAHGNELKDENPEDHPVWITQECANRNHSQYGIFTNCVNTDVVDIDAFSCWIWMLETEEIQAFQHAVLFSKSRKWKESWIWKYHNKQWEKEEWITSSSE